jgi:putative flippase GtrA
MSNIVSRLTSHIPPGLFGRYLAVGAFNTLFGYMTFAALTALLASRFAYSYVPAMLLSSILNISVAFLGYKWFVFRTKGHYLREWLRCLAVYGSGSLLGVALLPVVVAVLHYGAGLERSAPYLGGALLMGAGVVYNFLGHKNFSFKSNARNCGEP